MNETTDTQESLNPEGDDATPYEASGEDEVVKAKEYAKNQKIRAEKAEQELKALKQAQTEAKPKTPDKSNYSLQDIRALSDVHDEDVEWLENYAKFSNLTITEAKKRKDVQVYLGIKKEERTTAEVSNTEGGAGGSSKISEEALLQKVANQEEMTDEEMAEAARIKVERMKKRT